MTHRKRLVFLCVIAVPSRPPAHLWMGHLSKNHFFFVLGSEAWSQGFYFSWSVYYSADLPVIQRLRLQRVCPPKGFPTVPTTLQAWEIAHGASSHRKGIKIGGGYPMPTARPAVGAKLIKTLALFKSFSALLSLPQDGIRLKGAHGRLLAELPLFFWSCTCTWGDKTITSSRAQISPRRSHQSTAAALSCCMFLITRDPRMMSFLPCMRFTVFLGVSSNAW